jgi:hypothetical protein
MKNRKSVKAGTGLGILLMLMLMASGLATNSPQEIERVTQLDNGNTLSVLLVNPMSPAEAYAEDEDCEGINPPPNLDICLPLPTPTATATPDPH